MSSGSTHYASTSYIKTVAPSFPDLGWFWHVPLSWIARIVSRSERRPRYTQLLELDDRLLSDRHIEAGCRRGAQILLDRRIDVAELPMTTFTYAKPHSDIFYLYTARALRGFGDGFAVILLPVYLLAIGLTPQEVGIVASASLLGTAALTLLVGFVAPRYDLRSLLLMGAGLAILTGLLFPMVEAVAPVLLVAFLGTINPSAGDLGMLIPLEHALLTQEASDRDRTGVFARYSLIGSLTAAAGSLAAALPEGLTAAGLTEIGALRLMFYGYATLGLLAAFLYSRLPRDHMRAATRPRQALGPSRKIVYTLAALFSLDAFAGGFVVQSMVALWLYQRFDLSMGGGGRGVLLDRRADCGVPSLVAVRIGNRPLRIGEYHGVHPHPVERLPDPAAVRPRPELGDRALVRGVAARCRRWTCRRAVPM